jgi:sulfhydrogenase subunit gamma (sulfur reductase)
MKLPDIRKLRIPGVNVREVIKQIPVPAIRPVKHPVKSTNLEEFTIIKKEFHAPYTFLFTLNKNFGGEPGQFVQVSLLPYGEVPISLCSYDRKNPQLLIKAVGNTTDAICALDVKSRLWIRGPYGRGYPMEEVKGRDLVVIAGGTGVAPPRSVLDYVEAHRKNFGKVSVFLGFRNPEEILFKEDIEHWQKKFDTLITLDKGDENWKGRVGVITTILEDKKFEPNTVFVICGPPIMIKFVIELLKKKNVKDEQVYVSLERRMKCGIKKCGHCMIHGKYVCRDGPVFRYDEVKGIEND